MMGWTHGIGWPDTNWVGMRCDGFLGEAGVPSRLPVQGLQSPPRNRQGSLQKRAILSLIQTSSSRCTGRVAQGGLARPPVADLSFLPASGDHGTCPGPLQILAWRWWSAPAKGHPIDCDGQHCSLPKRGPWRALICDSRHHDSMTDVIVLSFEQHARGRGLLACFRPRHFARLPNYSIQLAWQIYLLLWLQSTGSPDTMGHAQLLGSSRPRQTADHRPKSIDQELPPMALPEEHQKQ